jgi:serine/threonine protein phosphatase PrpC
MESINTDNSIDSQRIVNDPDRERIDGLINNYINLVSEMANLRHLVENPDTVIQDVPVAEALIEDIVDEEAAITEVTREVDDCVYQLSSKQDRVYTKQENPDEDTETWTLALWDGHGSTHGDYDTVTKKFRKDNFMLDCLDQMIINGREIDEILEKDIFSEDDPVITLQRALGKKCIEKKQTMVSVGATMVLVKVSHIISEKKIVVEVLSCGDSTVIIFCNGEKVLENISHDGFNEEEITRLIAENRVNRFEPTKPAGNFEILDELHVCRKQGKYIIAKNGDQLATSQSVGHLEYLGEKITDEKGVYGISPYKARMEFSDTVEINIKLFSDGISDMISSEKIKSDYELIRVSNATDLANLAKARWEQTWKACTKEAYLKTLEDPSIPLKTSDHCFNTVDRYGNVGTDDVSCISWIQTKKA